MPPVQAHGRVTTLHSVGPDGCSIPGVSTNTSHSELSWRRYRFLLSWFPHSCAGPPKNATLGLGSGPLRLGRPAPEASKFPASRLDVIKVALPVQLATPDELVSLEIALFDRRHKVHALVEFVPSQQSRPVSQLASAATSATSNRVTRSRGGLNTG